MMLAGVSGRIVTGRGKDVPFGNWTITHNADGIPMFTLCGLKRPVKSATMVVFDCGPYCHTLTKTKLGGNGGAGGVLSTYVNPV